MDNVRLRRRASLLRLKLPPIVRVPVAFSEPVAIDCEWDRETGALELLGVGNETTIVHLHWKTMSVADRGVAYSWLRRLASVIPCYFHNAIADLKKLRANGFDLSADKFAALEDTMLAHAVLYSEAEHTLEALGDSFSTLPMWKDLNEVDPEAYNAADLVATCQIWGALDRRLKADPQADFVYRTMSLPYIDLAIEGEEHGIAIAQDVTQSLKEDCEKRIKEAQILACAAAGYPLNLGSSDQLRHYLYNVEALPVQRTREDVATADKDAISVLRRMYGTEWDPEDTPTLDRALHNITVGGSPILESRYLYAGAKQTLTHYVKPCLNHERIYPECRLHVQASGRHSYVDPPLSQFKGQVEAQLIPDQGAVWIGHDWSNIETWLLGILANDPLILLAKECGWDTHTLNYCDLTGTPYPPLLSKKLHVDSSCASWRASLDWKGEDDIRRLFAKRFVYRVHYRGRADLAGDIPGASALGFDAQTLVQASSSYLSKHAAIPAYWSAVDRVVDATGCVRTFMGRPRRLTSGNTNARYREASNHGLQGGVSDIYATTALLVKRACPWARLVYGKFDSMWWSVPLSYRYEFVAKYVPIVQREFVVDGRKISFPASFKTKERP